MAFVWKHPHSQYWTACYRSASGKRLKRTTKQRDRKRAFIIAQDIERAERLAGDGLLTQAHTRKMLSEILERTTGGTILSKPTDQFLSGWVEAIKRTKSDATFVKYRGAINGFLASLGSRASIEIASIRPSDLQRYADLMADKKCTSRTISGSIKTLRAAFEDAYNKDVIDDNPVKGVNIQRSLSGTRKPFTAEQLSRLLKASGGEWRTMVMLGYYTAARIGDCARMKAESVDLKNRLLKFIPRKTQFTRRGEHVVPMPDDLFNHLNALNRQAGEFLCPVLAITAIDGYNGLSRQFMLLLEKAKIDPETQVIGKNKFSALSFHSLRHTYNSALAAANVPQEVRMKLTGHKSAAVNSGYTHHEIENLRKHSKKLPRII